MPVQVKKNVITIHDEDYPITPGLLALLTRKVPNGYNDEDLEMYKSMLLLTSAHKTASGSIRSKNSNKYKTVIHRLFGTPDRCVTGEGLREMKYIRGAGTEYVYWDDINELVERLYLLHGSVIVEMFFISGAGKGRIKMTLQRVSLEGGRT